MHRLTLCVIAVVSLVLAVPAQATECSNIGAVPAVAPNDTDDGLATACGNGSVADGTASTAMGNNSSANGFNSTAVGSNAISDGDYGTAAGYAASGDGGGGTALGYVALAAGYYSTALGAFSYAGQDFAVVLGSIAGENYSSAYSNVGIGTPTPAEAVDVERSAAAARFQLTTFTNTAGEAPQYIQRRARGTKVAPTAVQNNDNLGLFSFRGYNGSSMGGSRATITAQAAGTFSASSTPTRLIFSTTPVGSTAPQSVLVITPDGKVQVKGVNLNVPDFVFEDDYELMPLAELKSFIDKNGHLPGMPSADEVNAGVHDLAGSDMAQLQKIEELTLYTLQQQSQIQQLVTRQEQMEVSQKQQLQTQQERIDQLEEQLTRALATLD